MVFMHYWCRQNSPTTEHERIKITQNPRFASLAFGKMADIYYLS